MKTILITGLDGSGKSTFFESIKRFNDPETAIIEIPKIDSEKLEENSVLHSVSVQINKLSQFADQNKSLEAKALSFFGSILCFHNLVDAHRKENTKIILCERHPLIDTMVYAQFYSPKLDPSKLDEKLMNDLDKEYLFLLNFLLTQLPEDFECSYTSPVKILFQFIFESFRGDKELNLNTLELIFKTALPNEIFFLKASPEDLYKRISDRKHLEPHETLQTLSKLNEAYTSTLLMIQDKFNVPITYVDASSFESLTEFSTAFSNKLITKTLF